jgi:lysozyme|tara:strand:- start:5 stop:472 length:468 start_codon:yes stop_codon:yes gene_type:complete
MNLIKLQDELANDEGIKYETYYCSLGHLTGGIGHLITEWDTEYYDQPVGTKVPNEQVNDWFERDIKTTIKDCNLLFSQFDNLPDDIQHVLANMCFQLGRPRLSKFKNMIAAVEDLDWHRMADEMENSRWFRQTPERAKRLIAIVDRQYHRENIPV